MQILKNLPYLGAGVLVSGLWNHSDASMAIGAIIMIIALVINDIRSR